ncbi:MAG: alpha/beta hydrolase, partial [Bacteroidales bacterium]
ALLLLTTFITLAQNKNAEPYDIYDYVGKSKALADIENFSNLSIPVYETYLKEKDIPYGLSKRETFDYFSNPAYDKPNAVFIFIHGGYWQGGLKESYAFVGKWFLENNIDFILIEYDLTKENKLNNDTLPRVTMTAIAGEIGRALDHVQTYLSNKSGISSETPVFLSGHSAGGHLAALSKDHPIINTAVFPISGLFNLTPIAKTKVVGKALQLNEKEITKLSPIKKITEGSSYSPDIHLYYGGAEMNELIEQSTNYYTKLKEFGHKASIYNIENADHFEILNQLFISQDSPLFSKIKNYINNKL